MSRSLHTRRRTMSRLLRDGGAGGDPAGGAPAGGGGTPPAAGGDQLGDAGKSALDKERAAARDAKRLQTEAEARAKKAEEDLAALQATTQTDAEKATAQAVKDATTAQQQQFNNRLIGAEVRAAAAGARFHDPHDAELHLQARFSTVAVGADGMPDAAAVKALVDQLATEKPHLVNAAGGGTGEAGGSGAGGTGTGGAGTGGGTQQLPGQGTGGGAPQTGTVAAGAAEYRRQHSKQT